MAILKKVREVKELILLKAKELTEIADNIYEDPSIGSDKKAEIIINATALGCAIIAAQPIPFADIFILTPIQTVMISYLSRIYGINTTNTSSKEMIVYLVSTLGFGVLSQQTVLGLYKTVIPFAGALTTVPLVYIATFTLGKCAKVIIKSKSNGIQISKDTIRKIKKEEYERLKKEQHNMTPHELKKQFDILKRKDYKSYKEIMKSYDEKIELNNDIDIKTIINKKITLMERLSLYENVQIKENVIDVLLLMNTDEIEKVERLIGKLSRDELRKDKTRKVYSFNNVFKVSVSIYDSYYAVEEIHHSDLQIMKIASNLSDKNERLLHNREIKQQFLQSFEDANKQLCISSPWLSYKVINDEFIEMIEKVLNNNIVVKIRYGIGEINNKNDVRNNTTNKIAEQLKNKFSTYKNFKMMKANAHSKILICDDSYYIIGSYNYLSFSGEYDGRDIREEEAVYSTNKEIIKNLYEKFNF